MYYLNILDSNEPQLKGSKLKYSIQNVYIRKFDGKRFDLYNPM